MQSGGVQIGMTGSPLLDGLEGELDEGAAALGSHIPSWNRRKVWHGMVAWHVDKGFVLNPPQESSQGCPK